MSEKKYKFGVSDAVILAKDDDYASMPFYTLGEGDVWKCDGVALRPVVFLRNMETGEKRHVIEGSLTAQDFFPLVRISVEEE